MNLQLLSECNYILYLVWLSNQSCFLYLEKNFTIYINKVVIIFSDRKMQYLEMLGAAEEELGGGSAGTSVRRPQ